MPIYEFVCAACDHEFESLQRLNDPPPASCPNCGADSISKKLSAAGFRLKGGGWYETDFKNKKAGAAGSDSSAKGDAGSKSSETTNSSSDSGSSSAKSTSSGSGSSE